MSSAVGPVSRRERVRRVPSNEDAKRAKEREGLVAPPPPEEMDALFQSQAGALVRGVNAFVPHLSALHAAFKEERFPDWPSVLLATILQTTAVSLFKLLPPAAPVNEPVDRRSIATLIRNLVDTHDVLDLLCDPETDEEQRLRRDILGHYLSGRINTVQKQMVTEEAHVLYERARSSYWERIDREISDKDRKGRLRSGESLFFLTRMERIKKACGSDAEFVRSVLADLSTYVHSVPPVLWMSTLEDAFDDKPRTRANLAVWLQIANFHYARSIRIIGKTFALQGADELNTYLNRYRQVFKR